MVANDGLNDSHFDAIAEHLRATLEEIEVARPVIDEVMVVIAGTRNAVLGRIWRSA